MKFASQAEKRRVEHTQEVRQSTRLKPFMVEVWWPRPCAMHQQPRCPDNECEKMHKVLPPAARRVLHKRPYRILALSAYDAAKDAARSLNMPQSMWDDGTDSPTVIMRVTPHSAWVAPVELDVEWTR